MGSDKRMLDNGIPVLLEPLSQLRSASLGIWVQTGSRDERDTELGVSHFLEHAIFRGTRHRDAVQIAREIDMLGGEINAFTSREQTAFYGKVLGDQLSVAADLLCDLVTHPTFPEDELVRERGVITEEIRMVEDDPEEWVHELHAAHCWGADHPLGRSILGTEGSVAGFGADQAAAYHGRRYTADHMVVSVSGQFDPEPLLDQLNVTLGTLPRTGPDATPVADASVAALRSHPGVQQVDRDLEQVHLCVGGRGFSHGDPDRFAAHVLNAIVGGGSSSRLFQEIREKRGLAYSVYSGFTSYRDTGEFTVYAGATMDAAAQVLQLIRQELDRLCHERADEIELMAAKSGLKSGLVLGLEGTFNRMSRLAQDEIIWGAPQDIERVLAALDAVSADDVLRVAGNILGAPQSACTVLGAAPALAGISSP